MKAQLLFWLIAIWALLFAASGYLLVSHDRTGATVVVVGVTPVIGSRALCSDGSVVYAVVDGSKPDDWPPPTPVCGGVK